MTTATPSFPGSPIQNSILKNFRFLNNNLITCKGNALLVSELLGGAREGLASIQKFSIPTRIHTDKSLKSINFVLVYCSASANVTTESPSYVHAN